MPLLRVHALRILLGDREIVRDVSFEIEAGECLAIIGPNGCGKSVLLKALLGILPHEGEIEWKEGVRLGYVPQKIEADRGLPITLRNLLDAKRRVIRWRDRRPRLSTEPAGEALVAPALLDKPVSQLSGGQFQRGLIAFALLGDPEVLLLDEPLASIDRGGETEICELLEQLKKRGVALIVVTHDASFTQRHATRVLELNLQ